MGTHRKYKTDRVVSFLVEDEIGLRNHFNKPMKIESYSFGFMSIDGKGYSTDLIIYPDGSIHSRWWRKQGHRLFPEDLEKTAEFKPEVVVIGTGANGMMKVQNETKRVLKSICRELIIEDTTDAVRKYNVLSASLRVVGMFHLTC